jgi:hypothetical protein
MILKRSFVVLPDEINLILKIYKNNTKGDRK